MLTEEQLVVDELPLAHHPPDHTEAVGPLPPPRVWEALRVHEAYHVEARHNDALVAAGSAPSAEHGGGGG